MRIKGLYIICSRIDAFLYSIRAAYSCSDVNFKLKILIAEKRSLFPTLADLRRFLRNWSLSVIPSILTLFEIKPISMSTKIADR